jgi:hypothetical protein
MAIVSLDVATAGGPATAATKRTAPKAIDRWKDDFIGEKKVSHIGRFQGETQDNETRSTFCR